MARIELDLSVYKSERPPKSNGYCENFFGLICFILTCCLYFLYILFGWIKIKYQTLKVDLRKNQ